MGDIHVETLATYHNLGNIYAYGYGALRQAYQTWHDGNSNVDQYVKATQNIISAVEFRTAELAATAIMQQAELAERYGMPTAGELVVSPGTIYRASDEETTAPYAH